MIIAALVVLGLALGSFVNALVWRVHEQMTKLSKFKQTELSIIKGRSMCTKCGHVLGWRDLFPVVSFVLLGGKCRYCRKPISWHYVATEVITAGLFVATYLLWPYDITSGLQITIFGVFLLFVVGAVTLALSDLISMMLPTKLVYGLGGIALLYVMLLAGEQSSAAPLMSALIGSAGYGGFFYLLYVASREQWIGGGDVRLGFVLGLLLGWQHSIIGLTIATYLALVIVLVLAVMGRYHKKMRIPFGPFLLIGAYGAVLWGGEIIGWYLKISGLHA